MATNKKPTEAQIARLKSCLDAREVTIKVMKTYHGKRIEFFKQGNFVLNIINAFVGVGALFSIGWQLAEQTDKISSIKISLLAATVTVLLLFFSMLLDFARKEEKHSWLAASYKRLNQEISDVYLTDWNNVSAREYEKFTDLFHRIREDMVVLKTAEPPILVFELFLSDKRKNIKGKTETEIIMEMARWQLWLANFFSMANTLARFLAKHNYQEQQKNKEKTP